MEKNKWKSGEIFGVAGFIVGLLGLIVAVESRLNKDERKLEYEIISSTTYINNKENASFLKILINDSVDVQKNHNNITAFNIKVENKGSLYINHNDYDEGFFGLKIMNGSLLEAPTLIEASSIHLNNLCLKNGFKDDSIRDSSLINIPRLSLEVGEFYIFRAILLHDIDSVPSFFTEGKIIGQKSIEIETLKEQTTTSDFLITVFGGDLIVQALRLIAYVLFFILCIFLIAKFDDIKSSKFEKQKSDKIKKLAEQLNSNKVFTEILEKQIDIDELHKIYNKGENKLTRDYLDQKRILAALISKNGDMKFSWEDYSMLSYIGQQLSKTYRLVEFGYIYNDGDKILFNKTLQSDVNHIVDMIHKSGLSSWDFKFYMKYGKAAHPDFSVARLSDRHSHT